MKLLGDVFLDLCGLLAESIILLDLIETIAADGGLGCVLDAEFVAGEGF